MNPGISTIERIRIQNALMSELLNACLGDKAKAIRLLEYERRCNPRLKTMEALEMALDRLCHDRGGMYRAAPSTANRSAKPAWANTDSFAAENRKQGPPDVNGRMALSVLLACAVVVGFTKIASRSLQPEIQMPAQQEFQIPRVPNPPPTVYREPAPRPSTSQAYAPEPPNSTGIFKCSVNGQTVYSDSACGAAAATKRLALQYPSTGFASPPKERLEDLTANRLAAEQAYQHSIQAQAAEIRVNARKAECEDLDRRVNWLDASARAPQSAQMQDWIRADKAKAQTRQFDLHC